MLSTRKFGEITGLFYDAALDPQRWPAALEQLATALSFCNASLDLIDLRRGTMPLSVTTGIEEPWLSRMAEYADEIVAQWGGPEKLASYPLNEPLVLTWVNPAAASERNRYYVEWARPLRLIDTMAIGVARDEQMLGSVGLGRHEDAGPVRKADVAAARLFIPHLQRAVAISRLLELRSITSSSWEAILRRLSTAVFVVGNDCDLLWRNPAAEELMEATDGLSLRDGRLRLGDRNQQRALARMIDAATRDEADIAGQAAELHLRTNAGGVLGLYVLPLERRASRSTIAILAAPRERQHDPCETVAKLFGLTSAERRVLAHIAAGSTPRETASRLGVGEATVRTHLLRIFDKTGVHRQPELVALTASFAIPLRAEATTA
jgi:DNA-binding CsgD family transcriptional regulator